MLIDTHAHLTDERYRGAASVIADMERDNLARIIAVGYDMATSEGSRDLAERHDKIFFAAGIHPSEANALTTAEIDAACARLKELAAHKKCVAIGEIGLDYHYEGTDPQKQRALLLAQLDVAQATGLPVAFHVRDAYGDFTDLIRTHLHKLPARGVMHCFSGSKELALAYADMGFYVSFSGSITFKNATKFPEILAALPRERVLIETDCPYLAPTPFRGQTNYPKYVAYQAQKIAEVWGCSVAEVEDLTLGNAFACFEKLY